MSQQHYCRNKHCTEHSAKAGRGSCYNGYHSHMKIAEPSLFCQDADLQKEILLLINLNRFPEWVLGGIWSTFPTKKPKPNNPNQPNLSDTSQFPSFSHWYRSSPWLTCHFFLLQLSLPLWALLQCKWCTRPSPPSPRPSPLQLPRSGHTTCLLSHTKSFPFQD